MLLDETLKGLGFEIHPIVHEDEFSYQVFKYNKEESFIEVTNEYDKQANFTKQYMNYEINQTTEVECSLVKVQLIKSLIL